MAVNTVRGFIFYIVLAITVIPVCFIVLILTPFTRAETRYGVMRAWGRFVITALRVICGVRVQVKGMENCPKGPVVVLSKHQSAWETFWLGAYLPYPGAYVYKESLNRIPFFGWALWSFGLLSIDRSNGRSAFRSLVTKGPAFLKRGWWIILFPEGTRVPPGEHVKFKTGGARLAAATGAPILPVALNSGVCWPKNSIAKIPGTITVSIGKPIPTEGRDLKAVEAEVADWITTESDALLLPHPAKNA